MKILFMGTPEFAQISLRALCEAGENVVAVVSQPDRPKGRGMAVAMPPVKRYAASRGIPVHQPDKVKGGELIPILEKYNPELIIVIAYGKILTEDVLGYPSQGCVNVHASLLPRYRGAAPIQWSVINGDAATGVATMFMDKGVDTGDVILTSAIPISPEETAGDVHDRLAQAGAKTLLETLELIKSGNAPRHKQDDSRATRAPMLNKAMGNIDWDCEGARIVNLVRGLNPWPLAYTRVGGKSFKVLKARLAQGCGAPGQLLAADPRDGLIIASRDGAVEIVELKPDGKPAMLATEFLRGNKLGI